MYRCAGLVSLVVGLVGDCLDSRMADEDTCKIEDLKSRWGCVKIEILVHHLRFSYLVSL